MEDLDSFEEAVALCASCAAAKLRKYGLVARDLQVYIWAKRFGKGPHYSNAAGGTLAKATSYTPHLVKVACECLGKIYREGYGYKKTGVTFYELTKEVPEQGHLFEERDPKEWALMAAVDRINERMGKRTIEIAGSGIGRPWAMKRSLKSPCYTTRWGELAVAEAA